MSLFDKIKNKKKVGVRRFIGAASVEDHCLVTFLKDKIGFLILSPVNLSILPASEIHTKIKRFTAALEEIGVSDYICINSTQSYEQNKHYLANLRDSERNRVIRKLDQQDIDFLDDIQVKTATNRGFLAALHFPPKDSAEHVDYTLKKAAQIMKQNSIPARIASRDDIKRCLAINLGQDIYEDTGQDFDGENDMKLLEMKK